MRNIPIIGALLTLVLMPSPQLLAQYVAEDIVPSGRLVGRVVDAEGKPVPGAVVVGYHVSSERRYAGPPTEGNGKYKLEHLPFGYFDVGVELDGDVFVADRAVNLPPAGKVELILTLVPFQPGTQELSRNHPGSEFEPGGVAVLRASAKGRDFWRSPKGIAILGAAGGAALLAIASGANDEATATIF